MKIAIIGAGVGGLALAVAFSTRPELGYEVTIYERDASFDSRPQGYSLTIQQAIYVLEKLGVAKTVRDLQTRSIAYNTLNKNGEYLVFVEDNKLRPAENANIPIPRQDLRRLLMSKLPPDVVKWGKELRSISHTQEGKVNLQFIDGETTIYDAVVGCDGVRSKVREHILGDKLNYMGVISINGISRPSLNGNIDADAINGSIAKIAAHALCDNRSFHTLDGNYRLFVKPFSVNSWMWQLTFPMNEAEIPQLISDKAKMLETSKTILSSWHSPISDLLASTHVDTMRGGGLYDREMPAKKPWRVNFDPRCSNITILGDAAHPMSPFKGQGANSALEDSWKLFTLLVNKKDKTLDQIFERFENESWANARNRVLNSRKGVEFLHTPDAIVPEKLFEFMNFKEAQKKEMQEIVNKKNNEK